MPIYTQCRKNMFTTTLLKIPLPTKKEIVTDHPCTSLLDFGRTGFRYFTFIWLPVNVSKVFGFQGPHLALYYKCDWLFNPDQWTAVVGSGSG